MPSIITDAFSKWNADKIINNEPAIVDRMVFALIPNQDPNAEISPSEGMPTASQIVHNTPLTRVAKLDENAVVYSVVLDTTVGDWSYNWVGLVDSETNTVLMIVHADTQKKIKTVDGQQGNSLIRNMVMEFSGAAEATQITVTPETWQLDFEGRINDLEATIDIKLQDKVDKVDITQELGTSQEKVVSQALLTESLADVEDDLRAKVDQSQITQELGQATDKIPSQKLLTNSLADTQTSLLNLIYPVGVVIWFAQNINPNTLIPGTTWQYIGENKTVRLANQNGENILKTGGKDSITLTTEQLPEHSLTFSGKTSAFDHGSKTTSENGQHTHTADGKSAFSTEGSVFAMVANGTTHTNSNGIKEAGNHTHTVNIGEHEHTVSGKTDSIGKGADIDITNAYVMLMGWYRTK